MNYRRSFKAQSQRLLFLAVYVALTGIAAVSASGENMIDNLAMPKGTATFFPVRAS